MNRSPRPFLFTIAAVFLALLFGTLKYLSLGRPHIETTSVAGYSLMYDPSLLESDPAFVKTIDVYGDKYTRSNLTIDCKDGKINSIAQVRDGELDQIQLVVNGTEVHSLGDAERILGRSKDIIHQPQLSVPYTLYGWINTDEKFKLQIDALDDGRIIAVAIWQYGQPQSPAEGSIR